MSPLLAEDKAALAAKANLQNAIDYDIIKWNVKAKTWSWVTDENHKNVKFIQLSGKAVSDPKQALYDYYNGNQEFAMKLLDELRVLDLLIDSGIEEEDSGINEVGK